MNKFMKFIFTAGFLTLLSVTSFAATPAADSQKPVNPKVIIETSQGNITLVLYANKAPKTVANFLQYINDGFYTNTIFHRVIENFMIQGGGFTAQFERKPTRAPVVNEAANGLKNNRGTIAMARTSDPHSATAQFFINVKNNDSLNYKSNAPQEFGYCVFGKVIKGMGVVDKIRHLKTGSAGPFRSDVPRTPVIIKSIKLVK